MKSPSHIRLLDLRQDATQKSLFLFGPRQTGKTTLLKTLFPKAIFYNLLLADQFLRLSQRPQLLREELMALHDKKTIVVIDEIQKLPILLDEVHSLIEDEKLRFILTGSSARKLKRGSANLLAGRAWIRNLFPLVSTEIKNFDWKRVLRFGALPFVYDSANPDEELSSYVGTYLKEEVQAEGLTRKIENFSRFLQTAAITNSELINFTSIASDAGVPARTVQEYYQILEDTLIGTLLPPYLKTKKRKAIATAKFYFFDVGVCNHLAGRDNIKPESTDFGHALEHFIFTELRAWQHYTKQKSELSFWRSTSGYEVDFLIGNHTAIEVKSSKFVQDKHLKGLRALAEDLNLKNKIVISLDPKPRQIDDILVLPVAEFLKRLWAGQIV